MARRRRQKGGSSRADATTQIRSLAVLFRPAPSLLNPVLDRRVYHPEGPYRPARKLSGQVVKPHIVQPNVNKKQRSARSWQSLSPRIRFAEPRSTSVCVKREKRKQVLHAIRKTGKGVRRRRPRRNWLSAVSCK